MESQFKENNKKWINHSHYKFEKEWVKRRQVEALKQIVKSKIYFNDEWNM